MIIDIFLFEPPLARLVPDKILVTKVRPDRVGLLAFLCFRKIMIYAIVWHTHRLFLIREKNCQHVNQY